ncbi:MAG: heparinase II/III family protein [Prolixibacteraceae bacterium]
MQTQAKFFLLLLFLSCIMPSIARSENNAASEVRKEILKLQNPVSVSWLKENLHKSLPRLVLNSAIEKELQKKVKNDPVTRNMYQAIRMNASGVMKEPLLERIVTGRRLLSISREMLYRINMLGMVYRIDRDPVVLKRINQEVLAVCNFSDWNPSHYLDVAEMSMAVALALDWTAGKLPGQTIALAKQALIEKGLKPSFDENGNTGWITGNNNWNQVCHGGMIAAAVVVAETDPDLAARTISRALDGIPHALVEYAPDGVYPEGSTYWDYGTSFTIMTIAMLESAFGTDFGIGAYPPFLKSAVFRYLTNAPSGWYYNYADCGDHRGENGDILLAWFAAKTGNSAFFEKERFLMSVEKMEKLDRIAGAGLVWLSQYQEKTEEEMPSSWKGEGANPIVIFTGGENDPYQYYLGGKGGRGTVNHGNMDGGSFVFELNGVRWAIDPGNQSYHELEKTGFDLWGKCQDCQRWTLLTKNNFGHNTLSVNDRLHVVDGMTELTGFSGGENPRAAFDLTRAFGGDLKSAKRTFIKDSPVSLVIEDDLELNSNTKLITWQMLTVADVEVVHGGVVLRQNGKELKLENLSHPELTISVISLYPAPLELDRQMKGLKRLEIRIPAWTCKNGNETIRVRLAGE